MTKLKLLSAALIAAAMLTTPAMARDSHLTSRHLAEDANASIMHPVVTSRHLEEDNNASTTPGARYIDGRLCYPAPAVGAFATQPWDNSSPCEPAPVY
jgi:hypothetical protein